MASFANCGKELYSDSSFCPWCGNPLRQTTPATPTPLSQPQAFTPRSWTDPFYPSPTSPHSHRVYQVTIGIPLVTVIILSVLAMPLVFQRSLSSLLPLNLSPIKEKRTSQTWSGYTTQYSPGYVVDVRASWTVPVLDCSGVSG